MLSMLARNWPIVLFAAITGPWAVPATIAHLRWHLEASRRLRRRARVVSARDPRW